MDANVTQGFGQWLCSQPLPEERRQRSGPWESQRVMGAWEMTEPLRTRTTPVQSRGRQRHRRLSFRRLAAFLIPEERWFSLWAMGNNDA